MVAALTISTLAHFWLAAGLSVRSPPRAAASHRVEPLTVRLDLRPEAEQAARVLEPPEAERRAPPESPRRAVSAPPDRLPRQPAAATRETDPAPADKPGGTLPDAPDPTYYAARELDTYPRPLEPLGFDPAERAARESAGGRLRVQLLIDEHGTVREVSVLEADPAGYFEESARSVLSAARFFPGMKDGRPVKTRLIVSVSFAAAGDQ